MINCIHRDHDEIMQTFLLLIKPHVTHYREIGDFNLQTFRQFQKSYRSPVKPVSDGFEINFNRKVLKAGDEK